MSRDIFEQWTEKDGSISIKVKDGKLKEYIKLYNDNSIIEELTKEEKMDKCEWADNNFTPCIKFFREFTNNYGYCPYCGESLKKPIKIEVGMFGYFWNVPIGEGRYNVLTKILNKDDTSCIYQANGGCSYVYFKPGLPKGFNQDGTPK